MRPSFPTRLASVAWLLLVPTLALALTEVPETRDLEFPLLVDTVLPSPQFRTLQSDDFQRSTSIGTGWKVQSNVHSDYLRVGYGGTHRLKDSGVRDEVEAEGLARTFLVSHEALFGTRADNIEVRNVKSWRGRYVTHYRQMVQGIEVWKTDAFVLLAEDGRLGAFGSTFFPEGSDVTAVMNLSATDAVAAAAQALETTPRTDRPIVTEKYWVPAPAGEVLELTLAYRVVFEAEAPFGKWESFVHAGTGEILSRRNYYHTVNVVGTSQGSVQSEPPTYGWCSGSSTHDFANMNINVSGGGSGTTDASGDFDIAHGGASPVDVTATFQGPWINVNRFSGLGADASITQSFTPGTPGTFTFGGGNSRQDERDTFFSGNWSHDFMKAIDPSFTGLDYSMPTVVGRTDGYCPGNAWWDGFAINFCEAASGYENTGEIGNVVFHEYGHGVTQEVYQGNGQPEPPGGLHEGNSDVLANFQDRNSVIGYGFYSGDCSGGIRDANNGLTYPGYNENGGHTAGQVIAGFHWEAWQTLLGSLPQQDADEASFDAWHYARDLGTPQTFPDQVLWTFMADDDDANLGNGTPHYDAFCNAAVSKGFTCPAITTGVIITHSRLGHQGVGAGTAAPEVVATIVSTEGALDPSELRMYYRVNGGSFNSITMTPTGGTDEYSASMAALSGSSEVEYYISAMDMMGNSATHPGLAPAVVHAFDVAYTYDDLETGAAGWTAGIVGDDATTGQWGLFDPVGTAAQPEDDATVDPGVNCFITGQCASGYGTCVGCDLGCNDIDNGTTTLLSPVYNLAGLDNVRVKYERWYSNNTGAEPNSDSWVVDVSNNGGGSWTNVENTMASAAAWNTIEVDIDALFGSAANVQLRFRASDLGLGSLVEGAVDDLRILAGPDPAVAAPTFGESTVARALALGTAKPNPFAADTRIEFATPNAGPVELAVYNVSGQMVRSLVSDHRPAGTHQSVWDGRDETGRKVSAGVYFYRLTAEGKSLTKKMTVMK